MRALAALAGRLLAWTTGALAVFAFVWPAAGSPLAADVAGITQPKSYSYEVLHASISEHISASEPSAACGSISATRNIDGTLPVPQKGGESRRLVVSFGIVSGAIVANVPTTFSNQVTHSCTDNGGSIEPCTYHQPQGSASEGSSVGFTVSGRKRAPMLTVSWGIGALEAGGVNDPCGVDITQATTPSQTDKPTPTSSLLGSGTHVLTFSEHLHFDTDMLGNTASIDCACSLSVTFRLLGGIQAVPGGPYKVVRAGRVTLDGSHSTGPIAAYRWDVEGAGDCPDQPRAVHRAAKRFSFRVLCDLKAKLTVFGAAGEQDSAQTTVIVRARTGSAWLTPIRTTGQSTDDMSFNPPPPTFVRKRNGAQIVDVLQGTMGENVPDCPGPDSENSSKVLCPHVSGSWRDHGYVLTRMRDSGGPFDGWYYVTSARFEVLAKSLFNHWIWPGSADLPGAGSNFYDYNAQHVGPIQDFLTALKQHEGDGAPGSPHSGHTSSFREFIQADPGKRDPRLISEAAVGIHAGAVAQRLDGQLRTDQGEICAAARDPLALLFNEPLWVWSDNEHLWVDDTPFNVGGGPPVNSCANQISEG